MDRTDAGHAARNPYQLGVSYGTAGPETQIMSYLLNRGGAVHTALDANIQ